MNKKRPGIAGLRGHVAAALASFANLPAADGHLAAKINARLDLGFGFSLSSSLLESLKRLLRDS